MAGLHSQVPVTKSDGSHAEHVQHSLLHGLQAVGPTACIKPCINRGNTRPVDHERNAADWGPTAGQRAGCGWATPEVSLDYVKLVSSCAGCG